MKKIIKRICICLVCLFTVVCINFALPRFMPGDAVLMLTGMDEDVITDAQYEVYKEKLGLDKSIIEQFADYLGKIIRFDLGYSYHYEENVSALIARRIPNTLQIALPAVIISSVLAFILGCRCGYGASDKKDALYTALALAADSTPGFLVAMILISLFAFKLRLFPLGGLNSAYVSGGVIASFFDRVYHLFLPVTTMVLTSTPSKFILLKNSVRAARSEKYVVYAKARGISHKRIRDVHIFRNIAQPFITSIGLNIGFILSGSMVIESIFSIKGMGSLFTDAIFALDFPIMQGCLFVSAVMVIVANAVTDVINIYMDPKVRFAKYEE